MLYICYLSYLDKFLRLDSMRLTASFQAALASATLGEGCMDLVPMIHPTVAGTITMTSLLAVMTTQVSSSREVTDLPATSSPRATDLQISSSLEVTDRPATNSPKTTDLQISSSLEATDLQISSSPEATDLQTSNSPEATDLQASSSQEATGLQIASSCRVGMGLHRATISHQAMTHTVLTKALANLFSIVLCHIYPYFPPSYIQYMILKLIMTGQGGYGSGITGGTKPNPNPGMRSGDVTPMY
jgi:hypothetical protein